MKRLTLLIILLFSKSFLFAEDFEQYIKAPNGKIKVLFTLKSEKASIQLWFENKLIISDAGFGFVFSGNDSLCRFELLDSKISEYNENWKPVWGQFKNIKNQYRLLKIKLKELYKKRSVILSFKVFDDGFAFQYEIPKQKGVDKIQILSEESRFKLNGEFDAWWQWADYNTLEKDIYHTSVDSLTHVAVPLTLKRQDSVFISIHESAIWDYSTMTLLKESQDNIFKVNLVPWADGVAVKAENSVKTPWRAFIIGNSAADMVKSNLILNLNEANKIRNPAWIKPMSYVGIWWEMHLGISTWKAGPNHGATTENTKRYIDFAADNGFDAVLIEGWNKGWEDWGKKDAFDFVTPYPDFNLKEICSYARSKKIEIIGHHETGGDTESYENNIEKAFSLYNKLGIKVVKTGYAGPVSPAGEQHHGQCMVRHYNKVMKVAAKYKLMLDVHEPIVLSGLSRTYPNLMTAEGMKGMEWNAWSKGNPPSHTCMLPFTRGIAGPMDYTAGIFDIDLSKNSKDRTRWNGLDEGKTAVHSTLSNQLALMIVLYSPLQMAADLPENYEGHPALSLLKNLPTNWDESEMLEGEIGEYVVMLRKKGNSYYLAGINNEQEKTVRLNFDFLPVQNEYDVEICKDDENAHFEKNPEAYQLERFKVKKSDSTIIKMSAGGGFFIKITENPKN